jgi:hypothetical protein
MGPNISCGLLLYHTLHLYKVSWKSEGVTSQVWLISYGMTHKSSRQECIRNNTSEGWTMYVPGYQYQMDLYKAYVAF